MRFRQIDHDVPGGCLVCGAGIEVTTHPITSRMIETRIPCRCKPKAEIEPDPRFTAQLTATCIQCGKPAFRIATYCTACGIKHKKEQDAGRNRTSATLTEAQLESKRAANRKWARKNRKSRRKAA